jgi:hypothetical protein
LIIEYFGQGEMNVARKKQQGPIKKNFFDMLRLIFCFMSIVVMDGHQKILLLTDITSLSACPQRFDLRAGSGSQVTTGLGTIVRVEYGIPVYVGLNFLTRIK